MDDALQKILTDLPIIRQIAQRPQTQNPLLAVILAQAQALVEIAAWTTDVQALAAKEASATEAPKLATVPARNGTAQHA